MSEYNESPCDQCLVKVICEKREDCPKYMDYFLYITTKNLKTKLDNELLWKYPK